MKKTKRETKSKMTRCNNTVFKEDEEEGEQFRSFDFHAIDFN